MCVHASLHQTHWSEIQHGVGNVINNTCYLKWDLKLKNKWWMIWFGNSFGERRNVCCLNINEGEGDGND